MLNSDFATKKLHFVGIGGAGMAPLAEIALQKGCKVSGSDKEPNAKTDALAALGADIHMGHSADFLPEDTDILIFSSAVTPDNPERVKARNLGIKELRRGEFLGELCRNYTRCVAISGSHGKTSITSMLVHILLLCGFDIGYLIGGSVKGIAPGRAGNGDIFVTEADESDGTHTALTPYLGIVPNADDDHSWSVGGEEALKDNFHKFATQSKHLFYYGDCVKNGWFEEHSNARKFKLTDADIPELAMWYGFQKRNALLALEAACLLGADRVQALKALESFPGVARRMTVHKSTPELTIIEDYAHHPVELANSIEFLRAKYPAHHLRILFQPHRYARLEKYFARFAEELRKADSVVLVPVFAAWTEEGSVGSRELCHAVGKNAVLVTEGWAKAAETALDYHGSKPLLLAVVGAGNIEKVLEIF